MVELSITDNYLNIKNFKTLPTSLFFARRCIWRLLTCYERLFLSKTFLIFFKDAKSSFVDFSNDPLEAGQGDRIDEQDADRSRNFGFVAT